MPQLILKSIPGLIDLPNSQLAAGSPVTDDKIVKINENVKGAVVRKETIFMGYYKDGDTVPTPVSPVDGYIYSRSELQYDYTLYTTRAPDANFVSGQAEAPGQASSQIANLYWQYHDIDDSTGKVSSLTSYYKPNGAETITHDGILKVSCFCQRASLNVPS